MSPSVRLHVIVGVATTEAFGLRATPCKSVLDSTAATWYRRATGATAAAR